MSILEKENSNVISDSSFWKEYPDRDVEFVRWYPCNVGALTGQEIVRILDNKTKSLNKYFNEKKGKD